MAEPGRAVLAAQDRQAERSGGEAHPVAINVGGAGDAFEHERGGRPAPTAGPTRVLGSTRVRA
jgi:hypothetical protein